MLIAGVALAWPESTLIDHFHDNPVFLPAIREREAQTKGGLRPPLRAWLIWDAAWYLRVCDRGYEYTPGVECSAAFLPLLPMVMNAGKRLGFDPYLVGLAVSNLAFVVGFVWFGRLVWRETGNAATTWRACLILLAYPGSFIFSAPYHESLYLALITGALLLWTRGRPFATALAVSIAALARLTAIALPIGLVVAWLNDTLQRRPRRNAAWLVLAAYALSLAGFCLQMGWRVGDPMAHFKSHAAWNREPPSAVNVGFLLISPLVGLVDNNELAPILTVLAILAWAWHEPLAPHFSARSLSRVQADLFSTAVVFGVFAVIWRYSDTESDFFWLKYFAAITTLALGVRAWWKRGPLWGCLVLIPILQAMATGSLMSMTRIVLSAFPVFLDAAELLPGRITFALCVVSGLLLQYVALAHFVNFYFVG